VGISFSWEICCETHFRNAFIGRNTSFVSLRPAVNRYAIERAKRNPDIANAVQQRCVVA
jgi:hypothetical protein